MDPISLIVVGVVGASLGGLAAWAVIWQRNVSNSDARVQAESRADALELQLQEHKGLVDSLRGQCAELRTNLAVSSDRAAEAASLKEEGKEKSLKIQALESDLAATRTTADSLQKRVDELVKEKAQLHAEHAELQKSHTNSLKEIESLKASQAERDASFERQLNSLEENKKSLVQQFEVLANRIFDQKGKAFAEHSKQSVSDLLSPFREQLKDFRSRADEIHTLNTKQQATLGHELRQVQETGMKLSAEAQSLATALRGQKKTQGNWGELVLENVLDRSGLVLGDDYRREVVYTGPDGKKVRPDVIIDLPENRHLIIDAKVSLNAYTDYVNSENEVDRQSALTEHAKAIKAHISSLSGKDYSSIEGVNSPPIVFMFIPIESAFVEAIKHDPEIYQNSVTDRILVTTPATLLTSLSIVKQLWNFEAQNQHAKELATHADKVFNQLRLFLESFTEVQSGLNKAQAAYEKAENRLTSGRVNLVKRVNDFKNIAPAISGSLPEPIVEKANLELEHFPTTDETE